eukprot:TRINITY_DN4471_c0_g1_i2.p1 TRINITY_DN4471_c0_g1~~TRINITY_DN4471_c0_g1_i2.p1  ORF type:complete len:201 (+),score=30.98 TRINITY_DN4471_c0_g1_i2:334-936(+)
MCYASAVYAISLGNSRTEASALQGKKYTCRPVEGNLYRFDTSYTDQGDTLRFRFEGFTSNGVSFVKRTDKVKKLSGEKFKKQRRTMKRRHPKVDDANFHFFDWGTLGENEISFFYVASEGLAQFPGQTTNLMGRTDETTVVLLKLKALVSVERGLTNHPYWTGSGDHVNSMMQIELYQHFGKIFAKKFLEFLGLLSEWTT